MNSLNFRKLTEGGQIQIPVQGRKRKSIIGEQKQLPPVSVNTKSRKPLIVTDPNDPRIKAYKDSLTLYNMDNYEVGLHKRTREDFSKFQTPEYYRRVAEAEKAMDGLKKLNGKYPGFVDTWEDGFGDGLDLFAKPVQPVIYRKPEPVVRRLPDGQTVNTPLNRGQMNVGVPTVLPETSRTITPKQYEMKGTPMYGPSGSLIGTRNGDDFYPDYNNVAKRTAPNQTDIDMVNSRDELIKYIKAKGISNPKIKDRFDDGGLIQPILSDGVRKLNPFPFQQDMSRNAPEGQQFNFRPIAPFGSDPVERPSYGRTLEPTIPIDRAVPQIASAPQTLSPTMPLVSPKKEDPEKRARRLNQDFRFMPLAANAVLAGFSNRHEQSQQDEYMYNNLANPMNYLPRNDSNNEWINKGTLMAQDGLIVGGGDEGDGESEEDDFNTLFPDETDQQDEVETEDTDPYAAQAIAEAATDQPESQELIQMYEPSVDEADIKDADEEEEPNYNNSPEVAAMYNPIPANHVDASSVLNMKGADKRIAHNNPGNIHIGDFAQKYGAKEGRQDVGGKVAIFPSMEVGLKAMQDLIFGKSYNDLTVREARRRWVGRVSDSENPIVQAMGGNKKLSSLSEPERKKLVSQFIKWEDDAVYKKLKTSGVVQ